MPFTTFMDIKKSLIDNKIIYFDDQTKYSNIYKIFKNPLLMNNIFEYIQLFITKKMTDINFNTIIPFNTTSIPYASDIAISLEKNLIIPDKNYSNMSIKFEPKLDFDDKILLVIDIINSNNDYKYLETIIKNIYTFGAEISGILLIYDQDIGETIRLDNNQYKMFNIFSFNDLCDIAYNNNKITHFDNEKYKFYSEKMIKMELIKLDVDIDSKIQDKDENKIYLKMIKDKPF